MADWAGGASVRDHTGIGWKYAARTRVRRVFTDYAAGVGQRGLVRALAADGIHTATGRTWHQSGVSRMLAQPLYAGKLRTGAEAEHEAIIDADLWDRVQAIRSGASRKGGRQADGGHLLVRGTLRLYLRGGDDPPEGPPRS